MASESKSPSGWPEGQFGAKMVAAIFDIGGLVTGAVEFRGGKHEEAWGHRRSYRGDLFPVADASAKGAAAARREDKDLPPLRVARHSDFGHRREDRELGAPDGEHSQIQQPRRPEHPERTLRYRSQDRWSQGQEADAAGRARRMSEEVRRTDQAFRADDAPGPRRRQDRRRWGRQRRRERRRVERAAG